MQNSFSLVVSNGLLCVIVLVALFAESSNGHGYFSSITIDGIVHNEGDCTRPHPSSEYDYPISQKNRPTGLSSADMTCGWLPAASKPANKKCAVNPGSKIGVQWHYEMGLGNSDTYIIAPDHRGPCIVYMAKSETGAGNVWFKVFEDGYNQQTKLWCVDKLRTNKGLFNFTIPSDLTPGNYLLRFELIALHEGFQLYGAQPYVGCAEITLGGSGTSNPSGLVAFPGAYTPNDAGIYFDIYTDKNPPYPIPGPKLYVSGSSSSSAPPASLTTGSKVPVTTGSKSSVTTGSSKGAVTTGYKSNDGGSMCYLPGTPNLNGPIRNGICGRKAPRNRCDDGQCCSQWGYCGPVPEDDGTYREYVDGKLRQVSQEFAQQLYCNKTSGDYRKVPCNSVNTGIPASDANNKEVGASTTLADVTYLRSLLAFGVAVTVTIAYLF